MIDEIYEAAFVPEKWSDALGSITRETEALEGALFVFHKDAPPSTIAFNQPDGMFERYLDCWQDSPSTRWGLANCPPAFTTFRDNLPEEVLVDDPAIRILRERGIGDIALSVHPLDEERKLGFGFARDRQSPNYSAGEIAALNALRPHIVRSMLVSVRLGLERAQSMVAILEHLGMPAAVLGMDERVIAANAGFEAMPHLLVPTAFGRLRLSDRILDQKFRDAFARTGPGSACPAATLAVADDGTGEPVLIHLLPVRGAAYDIFSGGQVLLVLTRIRGRQTPNLALLDSLFDLTRAEARLVEEMARGGTLPDIARRLGLSIHTIRTQFRAVAAKTGVRRQTELARLLALI